MNTLLYRDADWFLKFSKYFKLWVMSLLSVKKENWKKCKNEMFWFGDAIWGWTLGDNNIIPKCKWENKRTHDSWRQCVGSDRRRNMMAIQLQKVHILGTVASYLRDYDPSFLFLFFFFFFLRNCSLFYFIFPLLQMHIAWYCWPDKTAFWRYTLYVVAIVVLEIMSRLVIF
jgi:hypothetical protein